MPAANIMDFAPMVTTMAFGMCMSMANPTVVSATPAAIGTLTPLPCIPATVAPWIPGAPTVMLGMPRAGLAGGGAPNKDDTRIPQGDGCSMPTLDNNCTCMCAWAGVISVAMSGQVTVMVP